MTAPTIARVRRGRPRRDVAESVTISRRPDSGATAAFADERDSQFLIGLPRSMQTRQSHWNVGGQP